jgi:glucokinase
MALIIGIDVGGTNLRLGIVEYKVQYEAQCNAVESQNERPTLLEEMRFHADFSGLCKLHGADSDQAWHKILTTIATAINTVRAKYPTVAAVGIGFPGFIDPHTQKISLSPNLPGLSNVDLSADLSALIALPVITENDALAAAYGEFATAAKPVNNLIYLGLGTGVGGGVILNRQPFQGQHGVAMEVGHIIVAPGGRLCGCGNHGCMEQYASASGVSITYFEASGERCSAAEIAARAKAGDQNAIAAYSLAGESLAQALAHILKVIDVTDVVVGGGMSAGWQYMQQAFQQRLNQDLIPVLRGKVNVYVSDMDDQAGIIGAAMLAGKKL